MINADPDGGSLTECLPHRSGGVPVTVIEPGDTVVVPEKAVGGPNHRQKSIAAAQFQGAAITAAFIATHP